MLVVEIERVKTTTTTVFLTCLKTVGPTFLSMHSRTRFVCNHFERSYIEYLQCNHSVQLTVQCLVSLVFHIDSTNKRGKYISAKT